MFQGDSHQDTQEFLIWLLNIIDETLQKTTKKKKEPNAKNWLQLMFEGITTTETKCLACNNVHFHLIVSRTVSNRKAQEMSLFWI